MNPTSVLVERKNVLPTSTKNGFQKNVFKIGPLKSISGPGFKKSTSH